MAAHVPFTWLPVQDSGQAWVFFSCFEKKKKKFLAVHSGVEEKSWL